MKGCGRSGRRSGSPSRSPRAGPARTSRGRAMSGASRLAEYLQRHIEDGDFPGASYLVAEDDRILAERALGFAVLRPERIAAATGTIYDLASLTKPLAGSLLAALFESEGLLSFDDPL